MNDNPAEINITKIDVTELFKLLKFVADPDKWMREEMQYCPPKAMEETLRVLGIGTATEIYNRLEVVNNSELPPTVKLLVHSFVAKICDDIVEGTMDHMYKKKFISREAHQVVIHHLELSEEQKNNLDAVFDELEAEALAAGPIPWPDVATEPATE